MSGGKTSEEDLKGHKIRDEHFGKHVVFLSARDVRTKISLMCSVQSWSHWLNVDKQSLMGTVVVERRGGCASFPRALGSNALGKEARDLLWNSVTDLWPLSSDLRPLFQSLPAARGGVRGLDISVSGVRRQRRDLSNLLPYEDQMMLYPALRGRI